MRSEFNQFCKLATAKRYEKFATESVPSFTAEMTNTPNTQKTNITETSLLVHFFGRTNTSGIYHDLTYEEFSAFIQGFQREILLDEFEEYSRGHDVITEEDFAELFLKYTEFNFEVN